MPGWSRRLIEAVIAPARFERDMRAELATHLEHRADDLVAGGLAREDAMRQARVELGAVESCEEQCRDVRGFAAFRPLHGLTGDVRLAARRLRATPLFLVFAVVSLALGVGVTTAVYSILYTLFWKPLGIPGPERVAFVAAPASNGRAQWRRALSRLDFDDLRAAQTSFVSLAASAPFGQNLAGLATSQTVNGEAVSGQYFNALGVNAVAGRTIQPSDDDQASIVVLSHRVWRTQFEADPRAIGRIVRLGRHSFEVVGVAPRSFEGLAPQRGLHTDVWVPLGARALLSAAPRPAVDDRGRQEISIVGRLAEGRPMSAAGAELATIAGRLDAAYPILRPTTQDGPRTPVPRRWVALPVVDQNAGGNVNQLGALILGLVALVLAVACTNLANLMLARGAARQHEFGVRRALGASRWRLVRELSAESAIVAALGGMCAVIVTRGLLRLATVDLPTPRGSFSIEPHLSLPAVLVASAALVLSMIVFGLEPALHLTRASVAGVLAAEGGGGVAPARRQRAFIRWQVAISVGFFLVAAILAKAVVAEARHDSGVDLDRLAVATVHFSALGVDEARARRTLDFVVELLKQEPTIERLAVSSGAPFGMTMTPFATVTTPDKPFAPGRRYETTLVLAATPDIFPTLGVPIVRGRGFEASDDAGAPRVMVLSEKTARTLFGATDPLGRQIVLQVWGRPPGETCTIVGIARDTDSGRLMSRNDDTAYVPLAQHYEPNLALLARSSVDPAATARVLQTAVRRADPDLGTGMAGAASMVLAGEYVAARVAASVATALGLLTLILAMVGLYGVQAHIVARRTREVGVRMALGATAQHIERMVLGEGFRPVVEGLVLGLVLGTIVRLGLRGIYQNVEVVDPWALALVPIPLAVAAFLACDVPARRATRVDPNVALRHL